LHALEEAEMRQPAPTPARTRTQLDASVRRLVVRAAESAPHRLILLDYDGTLTALAPTPGLAAPDRSLLSLLRTLAEQPATSVHVTSGRDRATLDTWLGGLPVGLHAEHGLWSRLTAGAEWTRADVSLALPRRGDILALFEEAVRRIPGTMIERKSTGIAWHYRLADQKLAVAEVRRLKSALSRLLEGVDAELLIGHRVLEVQPTGADKGTAIAPSLPGLPDGTAIIAIGDDRTDEQLFSALPADAMTIHVGEGLSRARLRLNSVGEVRLLLQDLTRAAPGRLGTSATAPPPAGSEPVADDALATVES
jgi:trehalose 6-phosphate synthase/phosphatase